MKKKARIIDKSKSNVSSAPQIGSSSSAVDDLSKPISHEATRKKPTKVTDNGFTLIKRSTKFTEDGMETETQELEFPRFNGHPF